jgi:hypothetical protein
VPDVPIDPVLVPVPKPVPALVPVPVILPGVVVVLLDELLCDERWVLVLDCGREPVSLAPLPVLVPVVPVLPVLPGAVVPVRSLVFP